MHELKYLIGYSENVTDQVRLLISKDKLGETLLKNTRLLTRSGQIRRFMLIPLT